MFQSWWLRTGNLISHWRFGMKVLAIQPFMQKIRQDYIVLPGANCKCLNSTVSLDTSFGGSWQRELLCFLCPLFQGPVVAITLATGEIWSCQAVCVGSLQKEGIHVLGGQDPRRILLRRQKGYLASAMHGGPLSSWTHSFWQWACLVRSCRLMVGKGTALVISQTKKGTCPPHRLGPFNWKGSQARPSFFFICVQCLIWWGISSESVPVGTTHRQMNVY